MGECGPTATDLPDEPHAKRFIADGEGKNLRHIGEELIADMVLSDRMVMKRDPNEFNINALI